MAFEFDYAKIVQMYMAQKKYIMLATNRKVNDQTNVHRKCQNQEAQFPEEPKEGDMMEKYKNPQTHKH